MLLKDKLAGWNLILASSSPRRRQILEESGLPFTLADPYEVDETPPADLPAAKVAEYLAALKSEAYPIPLAPKDILLTADTTVILAGRVLGKPRDSREAVQMLSELSGREHKVTTGVALCSLQGSETFSVESTVRFRRLTAEEIDYYVDKYRPVDKAGAYGIQEWIGYIGIEHIEGSFYNVMGMPIQTIYTRLERFVR